MLNCNPNQVNGPPHFVDLHVNPGESVSIQLLDGNETVLRGPATITMISQHTFPPVPMPVQVPPGHMVQQIVDENGTLRHIILSALNNNNGSVIPAANLMPQQQLYPYCCCCCYCSTNSQTPTLAPPPPPPPPPAPIHGSILAFPAPQGIRRRLPSRGFSYSKRSTTTTTTSTSTTIHTFNNNSLKSLSRSKNVPSTGVQDVKVHYANREQSRADQKSYYELKNDTRDIDSKIYHPASISPNSVDSSTGYISDKTGEDGDISPGSVEPVISNGIDKSLSPTCSSVDGISESEITERSVKVMAVNRDILTINQHYHSDQSDIISTDTNLSTLDASCENIHDITEHNDFDVKVLAPGISLHNFYCDNRNNDLETNESQREETSENIVRTAELKECGETKLNNNEANHVEEQENAKGNTYHDSDLATAIEQNLSEYELLCDEKTSKGIEYNSLDGKKYQAPESTHKLVEDEEFSKDDNVEDDSEADSSDYETETKIEESGTSNERTNDERKGPTKIEIATGRSPQRSPKHLLPQLQLLNLTYTSLTAMSVKLKWTQPSQVQRPTFYSRHYMVEMILGKSNGDNSPAPATRIVYQGNSNTFRVSHLNSQQQYSFRVRTTSEENLVIVSNVLTITTPEQTLTKHKKPKHSLQQQLQQTQQQLLHQHLLLQHQHQQHQNDSDSLAKVNSNSNDSRMGSSDQRCAIIILVLFTVLALIVAVLIQRLLTD